MGICHKYDLTKASGQNLRDGASQPDPAVKAPDSVLESVHESLIDPVRTERGMPVPKAFGLGDRLTSIRLERAGCDSIACELV